MVSPFFPGSCNPSGEPVRPSFSLMAEATPGLSQICGHLIGDGYLGLTKINGGMIKFYGEKSKLESISKIYYSLFNKKLKLVIERGYFRLETSDTVVAKCLHMIGVPSGQKVVADFEIPQWIFFGDREIKRKFLQALCDDEMESIYKDKTRLNTWKGLRLRLSKNENHLDYGMKFFTQIKQLFEEFGIKTPSPRIYRYTTHIRVDNTRNYRIILGVSTEAENRKRFFKEIGFIYDKKKQEKLFLSCRGL